MTTRCVNCSQPIELGERDVSWVHRRADPFASVYCLSVRDLTKVGRTSVVDARPLPYWQKVARPADREDSGSGPKTVAS